MTPFSQGYATFMKLAMQMQMYQQQYDAMQKNPQGFQSSTPVAANAPGRRVTTFSARSGIRAQ